MAVDVSRAEAGVAAALRAGIAARDGTEETLAAQMAACHEAALACLANARRQDLPESAKTSELRTGVRLMSLFTQQLGALERHRTHLRQEREADESAARDVELRRRFAEQDAEREAEEALIYPERHALRLAARAAPTTDKAIFERLARRFERRLNGEGAEADDDPGSAGTPRSRSGDGGSLAETSGASVPAPTAAPAPQAAGAAVPPPPAAPEAPLNRQQRRALERLRRKQRHRADRGAARLGEARGGTA